MLLTTVETLLLVEVEVLSFTTVEKLLVVETSLSITVETLK